MSATNSQHIIGNLTKDPELKNDTGESAAWFTVAVNRFGSDTADFFFCKAKGNTAENLCKYKKKGDKIAVDGEMLSYRKEGDQYDRWIMAAHDIAFLSSSREGGQSESRQDDGVQQNPPTNPPANANGGSAGRRGAYRR